MIRDSFYTDWVDFLEKSLIGLKYRAKAQFYKDGIVEGGLKNKINTIQNTIRIIKYGDR